MEFPISYCMYSRNDTNISKECLLMVVREDVNDDSNHIKNILQDWYTGKRRQ
jgi:hypothetical protein